MYRTILVPLDGSALGEGALPTAVFLAQRMGARVLLARVAGDDSPRAAHEAEHYLDGVRTRIADGAAVDLVVPHGTAARGILDAVAAHDAGLVVMTTHGRTGLRRLVFGSVAEKILAASPVPVWLVPARGTAHPPLLASTAPEILTPLDGSPLAEAALQPAVALARALGGHLVLLRVVPPPPIVVDPSLAQTLVPSEAETQQGAETYLQSLAPTIAAEGIPTRLVVRSGPLVQSILDEIWASGAELLVMATHGRSGLDRALLGSVAVALVHSCAIPMVLTRPQNWRNAADDDPQLGSQT
ncbi:MAG: universal stress protein [Anaerolineae bacterium]